MDQDRIASSTVTVSPMVSHSAFRMASLETIAKLAVGNRLPFLEAQGDQVEPGLGIALVE
jgi:hypothetical protein